MATHRAGPERDPQGPPRSAWVMAVTGGLLLLGGWLLVPDERWRAAAFILGALLTGVGVLTIAWAGASAQLPGGRGR